MNLELMDIFRMEYDFSWDTETWFLPLEPALKGLNSKDASWQSPGGGNTIWQTVNHLNYYNALLVRQINSPAPGKKASHNKATFGDIGEPLSEEWKAILTENTFGDIGDPADSEKWKAVLEIDTPTHKKENWLQPVGCSGEVTEKHESKLPPLLLGTI